MVLIRRRYIENKRRKLFLSNGAKLLTTVKEILSEENIFFWLDFGTLLGAYREKSFIKHDSDIDLAAMVEDSEKIKKALLNKGFKMPNYFYSPDDKNILEHTFIYEGVKIDFFYYIHEKENNKFYCHSFSWSSCGTDKNGNDIRSIKKIELPFSGFGKIEFMDKTYNAPEDINAYLTANYGVNYMTPNPKFDSKKDASNITYFDLKEKHAILKYND